MENLRFSSRVSIITVVRNDPTGLANTLASITNQTYTNYQLIVIDGGSTDCTLNIIEQNSSAIDTWISEPDKGIYHAMNKGISLADSEWLIFMNAGDEFTCDNALASAVSIIATNVDIIFSDWIYRGVETIAKASFDRMNIRHQSVLYRKSLHDIFGLYVVGKDVTISDFIFFLSIAKERWAFCPTPIAICDKAGASGKPTHFYQRIAVEFLFGRRSRLSVIGIFLLYPTYRFIKRNILRRR